MQGRFKREGSAAEDAELSGTEDRGSSAGPALAGGRAWESGREHAENAAGAASGGSTANADSFAASHSPPGDPDDDLDETPAPRNTRSGSRLRLRNWSISTRLISLIVLPVVAATFFGALRIQNSMEDIEQLENMDILTEMTDKATALSLALQAERDRSAGPLVSGEGEKDEEVAAPRDRTDAALASFQRASADISVEDKQMRGVHATVLDIQRRLGEISELRDDAYVDPDSVSDTVSRYNQLIDALLSLSLDMAQATSNSEMIQYTRALSTFSEAKEAASIQRAIITAGLARAELGEEVGLSERDWRYGRTFYRREDSALGGFAQVHPVPEEAQELLAPIENGSVPNITRANQFAAHVFAAPDGIRNFEQPSYMEWYDESSAEIERMDVIEQGLLSDLRAQSKELRDQAERDALINGAITLLVLGFTLIGAFVVARSMVRSLRRLQDTAQEVARKRLPEVVKQMSEADPQDVDTSVEPVGVYTRDEIGRVAQAFDDVHREAVRLAGEQALLRGNVNAMFTNLSRRSQGLIQRQLSLISELESREADPDQLSSLFKLDHLATRMRRNGENLLVLAGEEPGRRWTRPVPLVDVLRAAASEVEQYERIELSAVPKTDVAGRVVNDLVHLLAELLENATSFSSPQTKVKVTGHSLPDGRILVEIHDTGIGLSPEDLAEINDRLANPPTVDVSVSRRMGLFVVGRLSLRHGIRIQLRPSDSGGTTALVMLPADVAQGAGRGGRPTGATTGSGQPSATLLRDNPTMRRPPAGTPASDISSEGTVRLPGRGRGGRGSLGSLNKPMPPRGSVPGGAERPALPSRPGAGGAGVPAGASSGELPGRADRQETGENPAVAPAGPRPSWASSEDTGSGRAVPFPATDRPREHDEHDERDETAMGAPAGLAQGPDARPEDTAEFTMNGAADATGPVPRVPQDQEPGGPRETRDPQETGETPLAQPPAARPGPARRPDELTDPLPASAPERAPERTPIFEERESTWFGTRRAVVPPAASPPDSTGTQAGTQTGTTQTSTTQTDTQPPEPAAAPAPAPVPPPRPDQPASAVPPAASRQAAATESAEASGSTSAGTGVGAPWRPSPNDERWRQAEQLREPSAGGVTTSGLPRRVPRANLVPGAAQSEQPEAPAGPVVSRAPDAVRGRLTNLRRGIQQGRQAGSSAGQTDRDLGPRYQ
ncbi:nitrate- and nitrite sensing domain-containing protein [Streptomyces sp. 6N223]|uniref:nitrate- and nitrite sensing domain-containing protein n=1 Tax=Streptomyces sp. 6N223 TaxID=3457412 RepID=UPI003FD6983E